jgi:hypothetical protein
MVYFASSSQNVTITRSRFRIIFYLTQELRVETWVGKGDQELEKRLDQKELT